MKAIEGEVRGRVQGVGFRYFTQSIATGLDVTGYVYNTPEGSVKFIAQGDGRALSQFLKTLEQGPPVSRVDNIQTSGCEADLTLTSFEIRY